MTAIEISDDECMHFITFYDNDKLYGFTLTRAPSDNEIEVMVSDQSRYRPSRFKISFSKTKMVAQFPEGTIDRIDGEDYYEIDCCLGELPFQKVVTVLDKIFSGTNGPEYEIT